MISCVICVFLVPLYGSLTKYAGDCRGSFGPHLQRQVQNYHPDSFKFDHLTCKRRNIMEAVDGTPFWPAPFLSHAENKKKRQVLCSQNSPQCNCWRCFKLNSYTLPDIQLYRLVACLYVSDDLYLLRFSFVTICGYK